MSEESERERDAYLARAKERALAHLDAGDLREAFTSMGMAMRNHPAFRGVEEKIGGLGVIYLLNADVAQLRAWIVGFR